MPHLRLQKTEKYKRSNLNVEEFGADFAYNTGRRHGRGDPVRELQRGKGGISGTGVNVHPGSSKDVMMNASLVAMEINKKWGRGTAVLTLTDQYRNMAEIIAGSMHLIENAEKACENAGVTPVILPIRGGTDGAQLSFKGLPCPNLGTGGHGYHGPYEHITAEGMEAACRIALELVKIYAEETVTGSDL